MTSLFHRAKWYLLAAALLGMSVLVVLGNAHIGWDFRNNLWGPAFLLSQGRSPYDIDVLFDSGNALWFPMVISLFSPLGLLSLQQASNLWWVLSFLAFILVAWQVMKGHNRGILLQVLIVASVVLFPPSIAHFMLGQFSIFAVLIFLVIVYYRQKISVCLSAFLLAVALSKPQLAFLFLPGFFYNLYRSVGSKGTLKYLIALAGSCLFLSVPLFFGSLDWLSDFSAQLGRNPSWRHPSILTIFQSLSGDFGFYLWLVLALAVLWVNFRLWRTLPAEEAVLWSLALTPIVTPYVWSWDFVLILPLFISRISGFRKKRGTLYLFEAYLVCWGLMVWLRITGMSDFYLWWVPWFYLAVILIVGYFEKRTQRAE